MAEKVTIEVEADVADALGNLKEIKDKIEEMDGSVKNVEKQSKQATSATRTLSAGFRGVGLAMKAAGIGIVLGLVSQLSEAMTRNQEVADTVSTAFNMIGLVFNKIITTLKTIYNRVTATSDNFDALGRLMKNFMTIALTPLKLTFNGLALVIKEAQLAWEKSWFGSGDTERMKRLTKDINKYKDKIKKAAEDAANAGVGIIDDFREGIGEISRIGSVVVEEFNNTFENITVETLKDQAEAITKATGNLSLLEAKHARVIVEFEKQAEVQRRIRDDVSQSIDARIAANDQLLEISRQQAEAEIDALEAQKGALSAQLKLQEGNKEIKAQIFALNTAIIEAEKREETLAKERDEQRNALEQERIDNLNQLKQIFKSNFDLQIEQINQEEEARIQLAKRTISDKKELEETLSKIEKDSGRKRNKVEQELQDQKRAIIKGALTGITELIGAETKVGKGIAIAQATMDTYAGATKALAQGGIFGAVGAAGIIAAGLANVRSILQTDIPGEAGGGSTPTIDAGSGIEDTVPIAPIFGAIGTEPPPVQAFVVESDVSSSQALQNDLDLQATL